MSNPLSDKVHLDRIQTILNFELPFVVFVVAFVMFSIVGIQILNSIMIIFLPYLIFVLMRLKKYLWIVILFLFVVIPLLNQFVDLINFKLAGYLAYLPLFFFLLYTFILQMVIRDWIEDLNAKINRQYKIDN